MPRHQAGFIARFTGTADFWPDAIDRARRRDADLAHQGGATLAIALHASKTMVGKHTGDAIEVAIVLGREPGPVAGKRAACAAGPAQRSCVLRFWRNSVGDVRQVLVPTWQCSRCARLALWKQIGCETLTTTGRGGQSGGRFTSIT